MQTKAYRPAQRGITLIELLTVVAVVAILGSIAVSSYRASVLRANRTEASAALLRIQAAQEKFYLSANQYATTLTQLRMEQSTERGLYSLALSDADEEGYTATATATAGQAADRECATLTIDATGTRTPSPATTACWR